jgi:branched-chain amino acid transport system permease protein
VTKWLQLLVVGIITGSIYGLIALGYVTIYRTSRVVNFAQGSFVMLGSYVTFLYFSDWKLPFALSAVLAVVTITVISLIMYRLIIAPIMKASLVAMILATIGASLIFENLILIKWGGYPRSIPPFTGNGSVWLGGVAFTIQGLWIIGVTVVVLVLLYLFTNHTWTGKKMTATASDPTAASLSGIYTNRMVLLAFAVSAAIGAIAGISTGSFLAISYASGAVFGLNGFVAAILGGWGSTSGAVVGGLVLGICEALATGAFPAGYKSAVAFVLLLLILYFRPTGILGRTIEEGDR